MEKLYYNEYYKLERTHWWFKARLVILETIMYNHNIINGKKHTTILNAGAATGATSVMLKKFGEVISLEYDKDCSEFLEKLLNEEVINSSLTELPFKDKKFNIVCAFDVIEHIEDDRKAIREIYRVLDNDGYIYLTVPAFDILWSEHDEINHHYRRYKLKQLVDLLESNNFKVQYKTYFNFYLFIPILLLRILFKILPYRKKKSTTGSDFEKFSSNKVLNTILFKIFKNESHWLKSDIELPFGVSALIIGKK